MERHRFSSSRGLNFAYGGYSQATIRQHPHRRRAGTHRGRRDVRFSIEGFLNVDARPPQASMSVMGIFRQF